MTGRLGEPAVLLISLRDLQWRRRRFAIAILGTALVFAMSLLISGLAVSFRAEAQRTLDGIGADAWIVRAGVPGPFTASAAIPEAAVKPVSTIKGVVRAAPLVIVHQTVRNPDVKDVNVFGVAARGMGQPKTAHGRDARRSGEAVVDDTLVSKLGTKLVLSGRTFKIVGVTHGLTYNGGIANVYIPLRDAQALVFGGQHLITAVVTKGVPVALPPGLVAMTNKDAREDIMRPLSKAVGTIGLVAALLWVVAAMIVGSVVYLSALERLRDFAVLKATGSSTKVLLASLSIQSVVVSLTAGILAIGLSFVLQPLFPLPVQVPLRAILFLPLIAVIVGLLASLSGLRRAVTVEPALAFGG
jgi:putative ABC transport system permease protein